MVLLSGCSTIQRLRNPAPPLIESEIPYKINPGIIQDINGNKHEITVSKPRWSVSEAYIYQSVTTDSMVDKLKKNKVVVFVCGIITLLAVLFLKRKKTV